MLIDTELGSQPPRDTHPTPGSPPGKGVTCGAVPAADVAQQGGNHAHLCPAPSPGLALVLQSVGRCRRLLKNLEAKFWGETGCLGVMS